MMAGPGRVEKWGTRGSRAGRRCGARAEAWFISAHGLCVRAKRARGLPEDFRGERGGRGTAVALRPLPVATSQGVARTPHGRFSSAVPPPSHGAYPFAQSASPSVQADRFLPFRPLFRCLAVAWPPVQVLVNTLRLTSGFTSRLSAT